MHISEPRLVFDGTDSPTVCSATFPQISRLPGGRILITFRGGFSKGPTNAGEQAYLCISDDNGKTFSPPRAPFVPPLLDGTKPSTLRSFMLLPLGGDRLFGVTCTVLKTEDRLPYFNEATEGIKDTRIFTFFSQDGGETFSPLRELTMTHQYAGLCHVLTGPPLLLQDGRIMVNFEVYKSYDDPRKIDHNAACIFSSDGGKTFGPECTLYDSPLLYAWDHRAGEVAPQRLLDAFWAFDRITNNYRPIHLCESLDGGKTWSAPWSSDLPGQPGNPVALPDGRTALVYMDRTATPTVKLALSRDFGRSFSESAVIYEHRAPAQIATKGAYSEAWSEMGKFTAGHPFLLPADNGLLCIFYAGGEKDKTNICLCEITL